MMPARGVSLRFDRRGWMGVEPTADASEAPATGVEDRETHRDLTTPTGDDTRDGADGQTRRLRLRVRLRLPRPPFFFDSW